MAWAALFKAELLTLGRSWVLRGWLIALALTEFFGLTSALAAARVTTVPASVVLATTLDGFLLIWSVVIIVLGAGSVSLESDVIADSILSRACTRTQFITAKLASRALAVVAVYLAAAGAAAVCAWRLAANDLTITTLSTGIGIVGLAILLLLSIGIALSVVFNNTVIAVTGALLLWYVAAPIFSFVGADYLSPASLVRNLPRMLKDPVAPQLVQASATPTGILLTFSKRLDAARAEEPGNYAIEGPGGRMNSAATAAYDDSRLTVTLGGLTLPAGAALKVTARGVADRGGSELSPTASSAETTVADAGEKAAQAKPGATKPAQSTAGKKDGTPPNITQVTATSTSVKVFFSKPMDMAEAEDAQRYTVESPLGNVQAVRAATYSPSTRSLLLTGFRLAEDDPVKVTAKDLHDSFGNRISDRGRSATYSALASWKYVMGLGIPTVIALFTSIVWFARRDL